MRRPETNASSWETSARAKKKNTDSNATGCHDEPERQQRARELSERERGNAVHCDESVKICGGPESSRLRRRETGRPNSTARGSGSHRRLAVPRRRAQPAADVHHVLVGRGERRAVGGVLRPARLHQRVVPRWRRLVRRDCRPDALLHQLPQIGCKRDALAGDLVMRAVVG